MSRVKFFASMIAICGLALSFIWQFESLAKLRAENESLRRQIEQLSRALTPAISNSSDNNALTQEQMSELLKLRGEVTQLRGETNEISSLRQQNEKLEASLKEIKPAQTNAVTKKKLRPEDALPQDIHPKDSWAFRGYDSPDATVESMVWAMAHGDKAAFMAGLSSEEAAEIEAQLKDDFGKEMKANNMGEYRILDRQTLSDDEVILTVYSTQKNENGDYNGNTENTTFKNIGGQWKVTGSGPQK